MKRTAQLGLVAVGMAVAAVAGCGGSSGLSMGAGPPPAGTAAVRGDRISTWSCHPQPSGGSARIATADVSAIRLCRSPAPGQERTVNLHRGDAGFDTLAAALAEPDGRRTPGTVCPMYADVVQHVLAKSAGAAIAVHVPVDGCGHYKPDALRALTAARSH